MAEGRAPRSQTAEPAARAFVEALDPARRGEIDGIANLEELLAARVASARERWPTIILADDVFSRCIAERLPDGSLLESLEALHTDDLYLATASAYGDAVAIKAFEQFTFDLLSAILERCRPENVQPEDVRQMIREKLFVASVDAVPLISTYTGRGELRAWFRVVVTRMLLNVITRGPRDRVMRDEDAALLDRVDTADGPDLTHLRSLYDEKLREIFPHAFAALTVHERLLLKQRYLDDLSLDQLATLHGVHRATITRQLSGARATLMRRLREELASRMKLVPAELESILTIMESRFYITVRRMLGD